MLLPRAALGSHMPGIHPPLLQLFGQPILRSPGGEFRLRRQQRFRLLAYVAAQGHPVDRDLLGAVFWPDAPPGVARRNLRKTWFDLKQLPQLQGAAALQADATTLAWTGDSDLARFQAQLQAGNTRAAIELCSGPLMQGMDGGSDEFQRWLDSERERLTAMFRAVLLPLLPTLPVADRTGALTWVEQLLVADPLDEDAVRAKARLLVAVGRSAAARRCHARWRRQLQAEVGVDAGPDLRAFLDVDSPAAVTARPAAATPASGAQAPAYLSAFVGRGAELRALQTLFVAGERLVTLLGPPGCGKTRLAAVAFERLLLPGTRRRWFVELDRLPAGCGDQFTMHVAAAVGLRLTESERAHELLASFLATEPTLLVLDNFEHRQADVPLLRRLMRSPHVRVLATSTVRLGVQGECVFALAGLSTGQSPGRPDPPTPQIQPIDNEALRLFEARCGQAFEGPARSSATALCALLEGQPLAIEMAAASCRLLPPAELHRRLLADLSALAGADDGQPPRQRSLRAAFQAGWQLLDHGLRQALLHLSVLRADFSRAAARAVADVDDATLLALIDHSLLRADVPGERLRWHPFVRRFALDKLATDAGALAQAQLRHAVFYADWLAGLDLREEHPDPEALLQARADIDNVVDAWRHALLLRRYESWETLAEVLALHYEIGARYGEGGAVLAECAASTSAGSVPASERAAARVVVMQARLLHWTRIDDADRLAAQALAVFERLDDAAGRIAAWRVHAVIAWRRGDTTRALTLFRQALALCDRSGHGGKRAMLLDGLGLALVHRGENDASRTAFAEALEINERTGNGLQRVHNLVNLALDALATAPAQASALARRALTLTRETGFQHYEPHCLTALALAQIAEGNAQGGRSLAEQAVALTRQSGDSYIESWALAALARGCLADQSLDAAADALSRGLKLSWAGRDEALAAQHLALAAQWCLLRGRHGAARVLMVSLLEVSALPAWLRLWLEELGGTRLPPAAQPMPSMTLASLVHATLGELEVTADTGLPGQA